MVSRIIIAAGFCLIPFVGGEPTGEVSQIMSCSIFTAMSCGCLILGARLGMARGNKEQ